MKKIGDVDKKIPDTNVLVITTVLSKKINEIGNNIPHHDKYITTSVFHKSAEKNFEARLKQANFVSKK